jgi:hypothetical protein
MTKADPVISKLFRFVNHLDTPCRTPWHFISRAIIRTRRKINCWGKHVVLLHYRPDQKNGYTWILFFLTILNTVHSDHFAWPHSTQSCRELGSAPLVKCIGVNERFLPIIFKKGAGFIFSSSCRHEAHLTEHVANYMSKFNKRDKPTGSD